MNWFAGIPTRSKLFVGFGIVIVLLIAVILMAIRSISYIRAYQDEILTSEFTNTIDLMELKSNEDETRLALLMMTTVRDKAERDRHYQVIRERTAKIEKIIARLAERNKGEAAVIEKVDELSDVLDAFIQTRDKELIPLIYAGRDAEANRIARGVQAQRYEKIKSLTSDLSRQLFEESQRHVNSSAETAQRTTNLFIALGVGSVVLSFLIALYLNSVIARPLKEISEMAERIASGDLTVKGVASASGRLDEVGVLESTFSRMLENLRKQTRDVMEAVNVLATSSNEIAATTAQLASGTEQTSVSVAETTTTVEEVKQTANLSNQKAKHVSDLAQSAVTVSQAGSKLVNETIEGISKIREQMEYIAETIVRLSEHNQAIGEIIASVDEIAEQSNLLAVNASIEASKAGEHGKGFIIVAQEIKSLAEQSKQATKQVRSILNDIQKASSAAVMATEKGSKSVEATVKQSTGTGDSIQELSSTISEASQAVLQIAASNQQQLVGMDQVALAMANIRQASAQNAASTKQVELTIRSLHELGQRLKRLIEHYKV